MSRLLEHILAGLSSGATYGLLALGLVLIYRVCSVMSFAHGTAAALSAYIAYALQPLGYIIAFAGGLAAAFIFGLLTEQLLHRVRRGGHNAELLTTIALFMMGDGLLASIFGADTRAFAHVFEDLQTQRWVPGLALTAHDGLVLIVALACALLLAAFLAKTRLGLGIRALGDNAQAALLLGLPARRIRAVTWGLASALGGVAGLLLVPRLFLDPGMMFAPLLKAFAAAVLGGLSSMLGVAAAAALLGVSEVLLGAYVSTNLQSSLAFIIIIVVLSLRPEGIFVARRRRRL